MGTPDIFTEPDGDPDTLANLGPLRCLAGTWHGEPGTDIHPSEDGAETDAMVERYVAEPIDFQTNGPQLLYGLRYHTHLVRPGEIAMFHDQVGYWLWEPATGTIYMTLAIPRGQVLLARGNAAPDATSFTVSATRADIASNPFLDANFTTTDFTMTVTANPDGTWSYDETTTLLVRGQAEPFAHRDTNTLRLVKPPTPNPLALASKTTTT